MLDIERGIHQIHKKTLIEEYCLACFVLSLYCEYTDWPIGLDTHAQLLITACDELEVQLCIDR